ncbi:MAG: carboxypeptidase-like regulatory domain-containing protein [Candidatus Riflebacteria bacterium]|nr:carboxypeptidase-like regulatory domain-containing protein [Candidatus Riflebacteria bacterium]
MSDRYSGLAVLILLCLVVSLTGCAGGGSQTAAGVEPESPEKAVYEIYNSWRAGNGPAFVMQNDGQITAQTETSGSGGLGYIHFHDFSGAEWHLTVKDVVYETSDRAIVNTYYYFSGNVAYGGLTIGFVMVRDNGTWYLEGMDIVELPAVIVPVEGIGVMGYLRDETTSPAMPIQGAVVEAFNQSTDVSYGSDATDANGYYEISPLPAATYYLVINRAGYEPRVIRDVVVN